MTISPILTDFPFCIELYTKIEVVLCVSHCLLGFFYENPCNIFVTAGYLNLIQFCILLLLGVSDYIITLYVAQSVVLFGNRGTRTLYSYSITDSLCTFHSLIHLQALEKLTQNKEAKAVPEVS